MAADFWKRGDTDELGNLQLAVQSAVNFSLTRSLHLSEMPVEAS